MRLRMELDAHQYSVCRMDRKSPIPDFPPDCSFLNVTLTSDELSIVCETRFAPEEALCAHGWKMFKLLGPMDFSMVGVLSAISGALADQGISLFSISTYDTDYILVREPQSQEAVRVLETAGIKVIQ